MFGFPDLFKKKDEPITMEKCIDELLARTISMKDITEAFPYKTVWSDSLITYKKHAYKIGLHRCDMSKNHYFAILKSRWPANEYQGNYLFIPESEKLEFFANNLPGIKKALLDIKSKCYTAKQERIKAEKEEKHRLQSLYNKIMSM